MSRRWVVLGIALAVAAALLLWHADGDEAQEGDPIDRDAAAAPDPDARLAGRGDHDAADVPTADPHPAASVPIFPLTVSLYLVDVEPHPIRVWLRDGAGVVHERLVTEGVLADFGEVAEGSMLAWAQGAGAAAIARSQTLEGLKGKPWTLEHVFLFPAGPLEGRVLDAATGRGIPGATVRFQGMGSGASSPAWKTSTGNKGAFRLEAVPVVFCGRNGPQIRGAGLVARAPGYGQRRARLTWDDVKAGGPVRIELEAGGAVLGRVVDHAGTPLDGAPVLAVPLLHGKLGAIRGDRAARLPIDIAPERTVCLRQAGADFCPTAVHQTLAFGAHQPHPLATLTRSDGSYQLDGLTLGTPWVVVADVPDRPLSEPRDVLPTAQVPLATADLRVGRYGRLRLDVTDEDGRAIEHVGGWRVGLGQRTLSRPAGLYGLLPVKPLGSPHDPVAPLILDPCPPGPARVLVRAHGYVTQEVRLDVAPVEETRRAIRMRRGVAMSGRIETPDGQPLYYAVVRLKSEHPESADVFFPSAWEAKTRDDGHYAIAGLRPGRYRLTAGHFAHRVVRATVVVESEPVKLDLTLPLLRTVELEFETAPGTELPDMICIMQNGDSGWGGDLGLRFDRLRRGVGTGDMGEIVVLENGRGTLRYREGQHHLVIAEEGYATSVRTFDPEREQKVVLRLVKGRPLAGVVVDPDGAPVAGAAVAPLEAFFTGEHRVVTDDDGRFTIPDQGGGPHELYAWAEGFPEHVVHVEAQTEGAPVRLVLPRGVRVDGVVWSSEGRPALIGTRVTLRRRGDDGALEAIRTARTDVRGAFTVVIAPGRYVLGAAHGDRSARVELDTAERRDGPVELALNP